MESRWTSAMDSSCAVALSNRTRTLDPESTLHRIFKMAAHRHPSAIALLVDSKDCGDKCTYDALWTRAGALAVSIAALDALRDQWVIALLFERSLEMLVAIFGVLLSGAGYLPLDPSSPPLHVTARFQSSSTKFVRWGRGLQATMSKLRVRAHSVRVATLSSNEGSRRYAVHVRVQGRTHLTYRRNARASRIHSGCACSRPQRHGFL